MSGYLFSPESVPFEEKRWLSDVCESVHLDPGSTFKKYNVFSLFPVATMILGGHGSQLFLKIEDAFFLHSMTLMLCSMASLRDMDIDCDGNKILR